MLPVGEVSPDDLGQYDLVVVGSPTHGDFPTKEINELARIPSAFEGMNVAAFDTHTKRTIFGNAAQRSRAT